MSKRLRRTWRLEVEWEDSQLDQQGWVPVSSVIGDQRDRVMCRSVGFVLADDKDSLVLASSVSGASAVGIVTIPRSAIRRSWRLR